MVVTAEGDNKKIDLFQSMFLRRICKVHWPYIISNDELLKKRTDAEMERSGATEEMELERTRATNGSQQSNQIKSKHICKAPSVTGESEAREEES